MKIEYDASHDLRNIEFPANVSIDDSVEMDRMVIDYAKDERIVTIEVLDASKRTTHTLGLYRTPAKNVGFLARFLTYNLNPTEQPDIITLLLT